MFTCILFDFFDVIRTDGYKRWLEARDIELEGPYVTITERFDAGIITLEGFFEELAAIEGLDAKEIKAEQETYSNINYGVLKIIDELHGPYKIGLVSNCGSEFLRGLLAEHDLDKYFDEIIISSEVGAIKPNPKIFEIAIERIGVNADETIFIDDKSKYIAGAEQIGITGIHFPNFDGSIKLREDLIKLGIEFS